MSRFLWTQKEDIGPSARSDHAMTYDSVRSRTILFRGNSPMGNVIVQGNDTWEWDGEFWTQWLTQVLPAGKITRCASIALVRPRSCLAGGWETLRWATLGVGTVKTGRNLTYWTVSPCGP